MTSKSTTNAQTPQPNPTPPGTPANVNNMMFATHLLGSGQVVAAADDLIGMLNDAASAKTGDGNGTASQSPQPRDDNTNVTAQTTPATAAQIFGFDCDHYPGDAAVNWLRQYGQFRVSVCYLAHAPGKKDSSWLSKIRILEVERLGSTSDLCWATDTFYSSKQQHWIARWKRSRRADERGRVSTRKYCLSRYGRW